jgi:hypothetical protein
MTWLDDERRARIDQRKPSKAAEAIEILKGLGWNSQTFSDFAGGLKLEELQRGGRGALRKLIPTINRGK